MKGWFGVALSTLPSLFAASLIPLVFAIRLAAAEHVGGEHVQQRRRRRAEQRVAAAPLEALLLGRALGLCAAAVAVRQRRSGPRGGGGGGGGKPADKEGFLERMRKNFESRRRHGVEADGGSASDIRLDHTT